MQIRSSKGRTHNNSYAIRKRAVSADPKMTQIQILMCCSLCVMSQKRGKRMVLDVKNSSKSSKRLTWNRQSSESSFSPSEQKLYTTLEPSRWLGSVSGWSPNRPFPVMTNHQGRVQRVDHGHHCVYKFDHRWASSVLLERFNQIYSVNIFPISKNMNVTAKRAVHCVTRSPSASHKRTSNPAGVNSTFEILRNLIPTDPVDRKLSKVETLRLASSYIRHLRTLLLRSSHLQNQQDVLFSCFTCKANEHDVCTFCVNSEKMIKKT